MEAEMQKARPTKFFLERNRERIYIGHSFMPDYGFCFAFVDGVQPSIGPMTQFIKSKIKQRWSIKDSEFNDIDIEDVINFAKHCNAMVSGGFFERHRDNSGFRFAVIKDMRKEYRR